MAGWLSNLIGTMRDSFLIGFGLVDSALLTEERNHKLQDKDGTLAHLDDIPVVLDYMDPGSTTLSELIDALVENGWMSPPPPPVNTAAPVVSGTLVVGNTLSCSTGSWDYSPTSYAYQWQENIATVWTNVVGETTNTYDTDHAGDFRCLVTATNASGSSDPEPSNSVTVEEGGTTYVFGYDAQDGNENFPGAADRALATKFPKANAGTVTAIFAQFGSSTVGGVNAKVCAYTDGGSAPDDLIWATPAKLIPAGASVQEFDLPVSGLSGTDAAGDYWLVIVTDDSDSCAVHETTPSDPDSVMANGTFSFSSPPATWPGTDGTYEGPMHLWCEYEG